MLMKIPSADLLFHLTKTQMVPGLFLPSVQAKTVMQKQPVDDLSFMCINSFGMKSRRRDINILFQWTLEQTALS